MSALAIVGTTLAVASCLEDSPLEPSSQVNAPLASASISEAVSPPPELRGIDLPACTRGAGCTGEFPAQLHMERIGQTDTYLYVGFRYRGPTPRVGTPVPALEVRASIRIDGCRRGQIAVKGAVQQSGNSVSWVEIPLTELPEGEFDLSIAGRAGGASITSSVSLNRTGSSVNVLSDEQRKGYRRWTEKNSVTGETMSFVTIDEPNVECEP